MSFSPMFQLNDPDMKAYLDSVNIYNSNEVEQTIRQLHKSPMYRAEADYLASRIRKEILFVRETDDEKSLLNLKVSMDHVKNAISTMQPMPKTLNPNPAWFESYEEIEKIKQVLVKHHAAINEETGAPDKPPSEDQAASLHEVQRIIGLFFDGTGYDIIEALRLAYEYVTTYGLD